MAPKMHAAIVEQFGKPLSLLELDVPSPGASQILVKTEACGVCHTDLHAAHGDWPVKPTLPFIPGHEAIGLVAAVGSGVTIVKEGDRVGVPWLYSACGHCEYCLRGWETVCAQAQFGGYTVNGGFAEYIIADPNYVAQVPAICEGHGTTRLRNRHRRWQAGPRHAPWCRFRDQCQDWRSGSRCQEGDRRRSSWCSDYRPSLIAFKQGVGMTRKLGTCVLVGLPPGEFPVPLFDVLANCITIRGSFVGTRQDMAEALAFAVGGKVKADIELQPLSSINQIFDRLEHGDVPSRVVLDFAPAKTKNQRLEVDQHVATV